MTTRSPRSATPASRTARAAVVSMWSVERIGGDSTGVTPQVNIRRLLTRGSQARARRGTAGRYLAIRRGVEPEEVEVTIAFAPSSEAISQAAWATASVAF